LFDDLVELNFTLAKNSMITPNNIVAYVSHRFFSYDISIDALESPTEITLKIPGSSLNAGKNILDIKVVFKDDLGQEYTVTESIEIDLINLTFFQRLQIWIRSIFK
jgi:hypothetical protein